jgi:hypothetical protein
MEQISIMDLDRKEALSSLPGRFAYIDECGNFGFDFDKEGTSLNYILCAVVVKSSDLPMLYAQVSKVDILVRRSSYSGKVETACPE